jgi:hypothetical protein
MRGLRADAEGEAMSETLPSPGEVDAITPAWLSRAVASRVPGTRAASVEVVDAHSGTTGRVRLRVDWSPDVAAPATLFGKLAPTDPIQRQMVAFTDMGRREARFYAALGRDLPIRVPHPWWSGWATDDPTGYFVLLEDLEASGCRFPSGRDDDTRRSDEGMIDTLAALHAHFWESPRFAEDLDWIEPPMRSTVGPALVREGVSKLGAEMPPVFHAMAAIYLEHTEALCDLLDDGPATLTHGDAHLGNTFRDGDRVGLLDWACICRAPGLRDVSYYLCNSVPTEARRDRERDLVERWRTAIRRAGVEPPTEDEAWQGHRRLATAAWIAATATAAAGDRMQSVAVGRRALERANQAVADLGTVELLREELGIATTSVEPD